MADDKYLGLRMGMKIPGHPETIMLLKTSERTQS